LILYLHGFASSPSGRKAEGLRAELRGAVRLEAPDLNAPSFRRLAFGAMVERARTVALRERPSLVVGSSLGALVALAAADAAPGAPLVLIAPALGFGRRWIEKLPPGDPVLFFHHGENREVPIHRAFFEEMAAATTDREPPAAPAPVVMGARDESVPIDAVREVWQSWRRSGRLDPRSRFVEIPDGDHGLTGFVPEIAREIRLALKLS